MPSVAEDDVASTAADSQTTKESPATSTESGSSKNSYASSFAYLLSNRRSDNRLFQKRSMPPLHLQDNPVGRPQRPEATRSPSYYRPKIVEDTLTPVPTASPKILAAPLSPPSLSATPASVASTESQQTAPTPSLASTPKGVKRHSSSPRNEKDSPARKVRSQSPLTPSRSQEIDQPKRPRPQNSDSMLAQKRTTRRALRIDLPAPYPGLHQMSDRSGAGIAGFTVSAHRGSTLEAFARAAGPFTPPEIKAFYPQISHGDHYFRTFGEDTIYDKPGRGPAPNAQNAWAQRPEHEQRPQAPGTDSSNRTVLHRKAAKLESLALANPKAPLTDSTVDLMKRFGGSPSAQPSGADNAYLADSRHDRRTKSDHSGSGYFGLGRRKQNNSDKQVTTPSTLAKSRKAVLTPNGHNRESSEPLSPTAARPPKLRWAQQVKERHSQEKAAPPEQPTSVTSTSPTPTGTGTTYRSSDGKEYKATSLTAVDAPNFLPSEMKRIDTPPLKEASSRRSKLRAFKSFFFDVRSLPSDDDNVNDSA